MNPARCMTKEEVAQCIEYCKGRKNYHNNLIVFRLCVSCGLRSCEVNTLDMSDVTVTGPQPTVRVRKQNTKGKTKTRWIPLNWDLSAKSDFADHWKRRSDQGAQLSDPFLVTKDGSRYQVSEIRKKFKRAVKCLDPMRQRQISSHAGRHTFISHLANRYDVVTAREAAGHSSIAVTNGYAHSVESVQDGYLYGFDREVDRIRNRIMMEIERSSDRDDLLERMESLINQLRGSGEENDLPGRDPSLPDQPRQTTFLSASP